MILKNFLLRFFYSICLLILFSCTDNHKPVTHVRLGGTYRIPYNYEITCLDPAICGERATWIIGSQILEGLLTYSRDETKIIPLLAESFQVNGLSLIFHLRKGVRFHDDPCFPAGKGREFTATDVKYSFERFIRFEPKVTIPTQHFEAFLGYEAFLVGESSEIEGFKVLDKYTFQILLAKRDPDLLNCLTGCDMFIVPKEAVDYYGDDFKLHPVGTGPFRFSEFVANEKLVLVKNENYWANEDNVRLPYLDGVEYILYSSGEGEKMLLDFQTGNIDECNETVVNHIQDYLYAILFQPSF